MSVHLLIQKNSVPKGLIGTFKNKKVVYFEPPWNDLIFCDHNHFCSSEVLKDDEVEGDKESVKNLFTSAKGKKYVH